MFDRFLGLPFHPLIVHATTVVVPAAAAAVLVVALWPRARHWASWGPLALSVVALVLVPITTSSGEYLERQLPANDLIERHAQLADGLLPWSVVLVVGAAGLYLWLRLSASGSSSRTSSSTPGTSSALPRWLVALVLVVAVAGGVGSLVQVARIGHAGAVAAWSGIGSS